MWRRTELTCSPIVDDMTILNGVIRLLIQSTKRVIPSKGEKYWCSHVLSLMNKVRCETFGTTLNDLYIEKYSAANRISNILLLARVNGCMEQEIPPCEIKLFYPFLQNWRFEKLNIRVFRTAGIEISFWKGNFCAVSWPKNQSFFFSVR